MLDRAGLAALTDRYTTARRLLPTDGAWEADVKQLTVESFGLRTVTLR